MTKEEYIDLMDEYELALRKWHDVLILEEELEDRVRVLYDRVAKSNIEE